MKNLVNTLLESSTAKKMIANLDWGFSNEKRNNVHLTEFNFIRELPTSQLDLFNLIFEACDERCKSDLCITLIKGEKIKF